MNMHIDPEQLAANRQTEIEQLKALIQKQGEVISAYEDSLNHMKLFSGVLYEPVSSHDPEDHEARTVLAMAIALVDRCAADWAGLEKYWDEIKAIKEEAGFGFSYLNE